MIDDLSLEIWQYAKRQRTWFKRDSRIKWFKLAQKKRIEKEVAKFLK
jgi:tRNA A37 N6-isopentenylltransferase MiaA